jgi:putative FmdB family regulatory protein
VPTYVYRCNECDHHFEVTQSMSDDPVTVCEACGGEVQRVLFAPAIHFKGSGFHNTDYGTKRRPVGGESDGSTAKPAADSAGGGGTGSAPASTGSGSSGKTVGLDKV